LFIDIVGYSKLSINDQHAAIEELNRIVRASQCVSNGGGNNAPTNCNSDGYSYTTNQSGSASGSTSETLRIGENRLVSNELFTNQVRGDWVFA
jgi:hypothetical protein